MIFSKLISEMEINIDANAIYMRFPRMFLSSTGVPWGFGVSVGLPRPLTTGRGLGAWPEAHGQRLISVTSDRLGESI